MSHRLEEPRPPAGFSPALMARAARLYYEDELSQQQIADRLHLTRTTVSRLLKMARRSRIVRIQISEPTDVTALGEELANVLGLTRAVVVEGNASRGTSAGATAEHLVEPALRELAALSLPDGGILGVSWGNAIWRIASAPAQIELRGVELIPVIGGLAETDPWYQSNEIVRLLGQHTSASVSFLHLPARVSPELRATLLHDPATGSLLAKWNQLDAAIVGIGYRQPPELDTGPALLRSERDHLKGAVGDIASRYFTLEGDPVIVPEEGSILGITREQLEKTPSVIGVAAGPVKVRPIAGAARARLIDILVTDSPTATALLELVREESAA